ncbi:MAG: HD domain-containing protein [Gemmatales bacterium]
MQYVARADRPHHDVSFDDFACLSALSATQRPGIWRSLQTRRWLALLDLINAFRYRDRDTWDHCQRVQEYALELGRRLKLTSQELASLRLAALVHDIGKMAVSDAILHKEQRLSEEEYSTIRLHAEIGERLIHPLLPHESVLAGIRHHHERMDGEGYPDRLIGKQIPLLARIISVADVFDALTQIRPYRKHQLTKLEAVEVIEAQTAGQLDPDLVYHFSVMIRSSAETVVEIESLKQKLC